MEGDQFSGHLDPATFLISIHSLRMEGDFLVQDNSCSIMIFQSTPSAWRETQPHFDFLVERVISIHSLRMEGDFKMADSANGYSLFQSTPSAWRETFTPTPVHLHVNVFQSTPSAWRETTQFRST